MYKYLILSGLFLIGLLSFQSCQYEWIEYDEIVIPDTISFSGEIVPIFEAGCNATVCHGGGADPDLRADNAYPSLISGGYVNTNDPPMSSIYTSMASGGSMAVYCTQQDADLVLAWIEQGAIDN